MMNTCEDCKEIRKLGFQLSSLEIIQQKQNCTIDSLQQEQNNKDIEHEIMIQNVTTRMDTMTQDLADFKKEVKEDISAVKEDIASIKKDIPDMFDNAVNKLLAKMFKYLTIGILILAGTICLAFSRPVILKGMDEIYSWVENVEVQK